MLISTIARCYFDPNLKTRNGGIQVEAYRRHYSTHYHAIDLPWAPGRGGASLSHRVRQRGELPSPIGSGSGGASLSRIGSGRGELPSHT